MGEGPQGTSWGAEGGGARQGVQVHGWECKLQRARAQALLVPELAVNHSEAQVSLGTQPTPLTLENDLG